MELPQSCTEPLILPLTHWGRVTHICVGNLTIIGSDNGLLPGRHQAITWTNVGILLIGPPGTNFSEMLIEIHTFSFKKIHLKMSSGKWRPFCLGLNVLSYRVLANTPATSVTMASADAISKKKLCKKKQGKSEGFESCDRPIVRKRSIWVKIGDVLSRVTLKFDGWPWKTIGLLFFAVSIFVQHFIAIGEFKLELQSGNAQFGSNSTIFRAMWPWNLTDDLEKQ